MRHNAALPNRTHNLHNLLVLPFARHEAALGLRARRQRHRALVLRKPVRRRLVHVIVAQRHLGALHPPDHIELLVRQLDIHPALLISGREPRIATLALDALEKLVELIALRWTQHTPPIDIVANMRQVVVPRHRHLAYAVRHVLRTRITVILRLNRRIHRLELTRRIRAHHAPTLRAVIIPRLVKEARSHSRVDPQLVRTPLPLVGLDSRPRHHPRQRRVTLRHVLIRLGIRILRIRLVVPLLNLLRVKA